MRSLALAFVLVGGFYLVLIDTVDTPELYAGAGVVTLAVALFAAGRDPDAELRTRLIWWLRAGWALVRVPADIAITSWAAIVQLRHRHARCGRLRAVTFAAGGEQSEDAGRRALAEALGSLAPNTIIVGVDAERGLILAHELRPRQGRDSIDVLRLG